MKYRLGNAIISKAKIFSKTPQDRQYQFFIFAEMRKKGKLASLLERSDVTGIFQSFSKGWSVCFENLA